MFSQIFHIAHFKSSVLRHNVDFADRCQFSIRKNIFLLECASPKDTILNQAWFARFDCRAARDAMIEEESAGFEQAMNLGKIFRQVTSPDMLKHPNAYNLIKRLV